MLEKKLQTFLRVNMQKLNTQLVLVWKGPFKPMLQFQDFGFHLHVLLFCFSVLFDQMSQAGSGFVSLDQ